MGCAANPDIGLDRGFNKVRAEATYYVYVGAESADLIHRIRLGPGGLTVDQTTAVGETAVETEGPHGHNGSHSRWTVRFYRELQSPWGTRTLYGFCCVYP